MEFPFDINYILPYDITIFNGDYRVLNKGQITRIFASEKLTAVIDAMGVASFKAQGLYGAVTTSRKFRASDHRLYIIKEANHNNNLGAVIGILKVGEKHLYIYDTNGKVYERTPLCVLDFYVHESKQRLGYGKRLFDMMLEYEKCAPYELAIDRPSNKCLAFLHKHYNLSSPIHQVNNYVVYHAFFNVPSDPLNRKLLTSKQHSESFNWLSSNERQQSRPFSEIIEMNRSSSRGLVSNENGMFTPHQQQPLTARHESQQRLPSVSDEYSVQSHKPSYGRNFNQNGFLREQITPIHSKSYISRTHSHIFGQNYPFLNAERNNSTIRTTPTNHQSASIYDSRRVIEKFPQVSKPESYTSIFTFPSLMKAPNTWRQPQSTVSSASSAWKLFGIE